MTKCNFCNISFEPKRKNVKYCYSDNCKQERQKIFRRKHRKKNKTWLNYKQKARGLLKKYLIQLSIDDVCIICEDSNIEYHHIDYKLPFIVYPLCRTHHIEIHKN